MVRGQQAILRVIGPLSILVMVATVICTTLGFVLARQADDHLTAEHRQALRGAIEALQAVSPDFPAVDPKLLLLLERASGLNGLTFDPDGFADRREIQPLNDRNGRIIGWFSWEAERPATATMRRLLPFAVLIALGVFGVGSLAMWQLPRLGPFLGSRPRRGEPGATGGFPTPPPHQEPLSGHP